MREHLCLLRYFNTNSSLSKWLLSSTSGYFTTKSCSLIRGLVFIVYSSFSLSGALVFSSMMSSFTFEFKLRSIPRILTSSLFRSMIELNSMSSSSSYLSAIVRSSMMLITFTIFSPFLIFYIHLSLHYFIYLFMALIDPLNFC